MAEQSESLKKSLEEYKGALRELIQMRGEDFSRLVCEGVLAEPGTRVPFALPKIDGGDHRRGGASSRPNAI